MGNKKNKTLLQMKLIALVALFAGVEAVKVHSHDFVKLAHKAKHTKQVKQLIKMRIREPECPELSAAEEEEIADAIHGMPDDLEITGQDYLDYMEAEGIELTEDEILHAMDMYEEHCK